MPPRIPGSVADVVVRPGVSRCWSSCRPPSASMARVASRPAASSDVSSSSQPLNTVSFGSTRHFTRGKCMSREQRQQQQQRRPSPFSPSPSPTTTPSSSYHASAATLAATESGYADELQRSTPPSDTSPVPQRRLPRWSTTPAGMQAPFSVHKNDPANRFPVNEDPAVLDRAWVAVFGEGGADLCPAEVKWLAVTHKSFDQGRRGFNDRLCFLGKRIVDLQTSLAILAQGGVPEAEGTVAGIGGRAAAADTDSLATQGQPQRKRQKSADNTDDYGRELFQHPVSRILPKLTPDARSEHTSQRRLALLAREFGLHAVVRWKPRSAADLQGSGYDIVTVQALYAMIGALALHRGGDVAVKAVRARILPRIGLDV